MSRKRPDLKPREQVLTVFESLRRMLPILWGLAPGLLLGVAGLNVAQAAVPALQLYVTRALVDAAQAAIAQGPAQLRPAYVMLAAQVALTLARAAFAAMQRLASFSLQRQAVYHLEERIAAKASRLPLTFFDRPDYHDQMQRAQAGLGVRGLNMVDAGLQVLQNLLTVIAYLAILAQFHWVLAAAMLLLAAPVLITNLRMGEWRFMQHRRHTETTRRAGYVLSLLRQRDSAKEVRVFGLQEHLTERWRQLFWQTTREQVALEGQATWARLGSEALAGVAGTAAAGSVRYDGVEVTSIEPERLRRNVTAIFQDFVHYQLTARENVVFGRVEAMGDEVALREAAAKGGADEVAAGLRAGYDTQVGSVFTGGQDLSYGQWQKLALSRAFFRDAAVIVLDEPTAALDPRAEAAVFERFAGLAAGKTALLISHRLGTCRHADRVLVLKEGRLIEQGNHEQLMALNGEYARMFALQAQWYVSR